jgi:uncharacterized membrane protein
MRRNTSKVSMMDLERLGLLGVLIGGAVPWLEAVAVIPAGILLGLPPVAVVAIAIVGNLSTVALVAFGGERIRSRMLVRRRRRATGPEGGRASRAERVMSRFGLPGLAILGPLGVGTQLSAAIAVSLGISGRRAFAWVGASTVGWSVAVALLVVWGIDVAGQGAAS